MLYWHSGWAWLWMTGVMLGFWVLVAWVAVTVARGGGDSRSAVPTPERILADRFARGEIDEDEYHQRLDALRDRARAGR